MLRDSFKKRKRMPTNQFRFALIELRIGGNESNYMIINEIHVLIQEIEWNGVERENKQKSNNRRTKQLMNQ